MDDRERIAKVEGAMESHKEQLDRIEQELIRQRQAWWDWRDHTDRGLADLRDHTDRGFAEIRANIDNLRTEVARSARWQISTTIVLVLAVLGLLAKAFGVT